MRTLRKTTGRTARNWRKWVEGTNRPGRRRFYIVIFAPDVYNQEHVQLRDSSGRAPLGASLHRRTGMMNRLRGWKGLPKRVADNHTEAGL
jgi:hypothetical protein